MLPVLLAMGLVWFGGRTLGWSARRRLVPVLLLWAFWLAVLLGRPQEAALRDAVVWGLLPPLLLAARAYAGWLARLRTRASLKAPRGDLPAVAPAAQPPGQGGAAALSAEELGRYSRHILLREIGGSGQRRLKDARVLVIGAGGLGSPVLQYLAAAGVGHLAVIDDDTVDLSNLHRQVIHETASLGQAKVESAARRLAAQNPHVEIRPIAARLDEALAAGLFPEFDLILDGTDNFDTRYLANRAAVAAGRPLLIGALTQWEGQVALLDPARGGPCYACLFPTRPAEGLVPACSVAGVIGPLPGMIGTLMATEALKLLTGAGRDLRGRLLIWDGLEAEMREIRVKPAPDCAVCGGRGH